MFCGIVLELGMGFRVVRFVECSRLLRGVVSSYSKA